MQVAAVRDVVLGAVPLLEIDEWKTIVNRLRAPIAPRQADRLGPDGVQLVRQIERPEDLHRIGTEVDAGAELRELGRLFVDLHLEALTAERDGRRQSAEASSYNGDPTRASHATFPPPSTLDCNGHPCHPLTSWDGCASLAASEVRYSAAMREA